MRALLATAGLLVLAGPAAATPPTAHTLRKSVNGPIAAIAQDGSSIAWLSSTHKSIEEIATTILRDLRPDRLIY